MRVYRTRNADDSTSAFTVSPEEHFAALEDAEGAGWALGGVFHSHPNGPARPSMVDVTTALDPAWVYVVVGLRGRPEIRAWHIEGGEIYEIALA